MKQKAIAPKAYSQIAPKGKDEEVPPGIERLKRQTGNVTD